MDTPAFGAILQPKDSRDYDLSKAEKGSLSIPQSVYQSVPVAFQGHQPACGAHAGTSLQAFLGAMQGSSDTDNSPRFLWKEIKDVDGFPIDSGTDMYSIFRQLKGVGVCSIGLAPNTVTLSESEYRNLSTTEAMLSDASNKKIQAFATIYSPTWPQLQAAVAQFGAVLIQFQCGQNMYTAADGTVTWEESEILPLSAKNFKMDSGHFVVGRQTLPGENPSYVYWRNSFGPTWGKGGDGYFDESYLPYVYAIGTAIEAAHATPAVTKLTFSKNLSYGMTDPDVKALQKVLGVIQTGFFGTLTLAAVIAYQKANGISPVSGFVGPITRSHLNA